MRARAYCCVVIGLLAYAWLCFVVHMKSSPSSSVPKKHASNTSATSTGEPPSKIHKSVYQQILAKGGATKSSLANTLRVLHDNRLINLTTVAVNTLRKEAQHAEEDHAFRSKTPYGPVVQSMHLPMDGGAQAHEWEYVNPFAYMHHLTFMSQAFSSMMNTCLVEHGCCLTLILYIDEINPGDPLRPDATRTMQAIYWAFKEWPQYVLQRSECWPMFGLLRTCIANEVLGGVSGLMKAILLTFFSPTGVNLLDGFTVMNNGVPQMMRGKFGGFVSDEKALKEIYSVKGAGGTKPCIKCLNVYQFLTAHIMERLTRSTGRPHVGIDCNDYSQFEYATDDIFWELMDRVTAAKDGPVGQFKALMQHTGIKYNPHGVFADPHLRASVLKPIENYIRDPLHTLVSGGVTGTHIAFLIQSITAVGVSLERFAEFGLRFKFPAALPKVSPSWFTPNMFKADKVKHFANVQLSLVTILFAFMVDVFQAEGVIDEHVRCFILMYEIIEITRLGCYDAVPFADYMKRAILEHHALFKKLYGETFDNAVKPKFHHLLHIPEDMLFHLILLSCWVTERKHKDVKSAAKHVFNRVEHTATVDLVNRQTHRFVTADNLFSAQYLVSPQPARHPQPGFVSVAAVLRCGQVRKGDLVYMRDNRVGQVLSFAEAHEQKLVAVGMLRPCGVDRWCTMDEMPVVEIYDCDEIVAPLIWYSPSADVIRIITPMVVRLKLEGR